MAPNFLLKNPMLLQNLKLIQDSDIFIASYPRSGNTWLRRLIADVILQLNDFQTSTELPIDFSRIIPDIYKHDINSIDKSINIPCRAIKTHEFYDEKYKKVIYIFRSPLDSLYSYYHYNLRFPGSENRLPQVADRFCIQKVEEWIQHIESYLQAKAEREESILFISYELMHTYPLEVLRWCLNFIDIEASEEVCRKAIENHQFERVKSKEQLGNFLKPFYRKGQVGDAKNHLKTETIRFIENQTQTIYERGLLASTEVASFQSWGSILNKYQELEYINIHVQNIQKQYSKVNILFSINVNHENIQKISKYTNIQISILEHENNKLENHTSSNSLVSSQYYRIPSLESWKQSTESAAFFWDMVVFTAKDIYQFGLTNLVNSFPSKYIAFLNSIDCFQDWIIQKQLSQLGFIQNKQNPIIYQFDNQNTSVINKKQKQLPKVLENKLKASLNLKEINLLICPDWHKNEEDLFEDLKKVIAAVMPHEKASNITLVVDTADISEEQVNILFSSITMNLLMEEELELNEDAEISITGKLSEIQWQALLPSFQARIILDNEHSEKISQLGIDQLPAYKADEIGKWLNEQSIKTKPTLRLLHNMARSGGTLVSKCLATMDSTLLLSELHPSGMEMFHPLKQAHDWFQLFSADDLIEWIGKPISFPNAIALIQKRAEERGLNLVVRDWAHLDFTGVPFISQPSYRLQTAEVLADKFRLVQMAVVRHPIDQWLSVSTRTVARDQLSVEEFLRGYLEFARQCRDIGFIRYEDFTRDPDAQLQTLCQKLELTFDPEYKNRWMHYDKITGDRSTATTIEPRQRKEIDPELLAQFENNEHYQEAIRLLGYTHPE